ncbi:MAG TPA: hypothetical protein GX702_14580 [Chloroflexi bacterium]|nr:hypothetical protein [Chloroflexota bacterium]
MTEIQTHDRSKTTWGSRHDKDITIDQRTRLTAELLLALSVVQLSEMSVTPGGCHQGTGLDISGYYAWYIGYVLRGEDVPPHVAIADATTVAHAGGHAYEEMMLAEVERIADRAWVEVISSRDGRGLMIDLARSDGDWRIVDITRC